jgi:glucose-6-phosphate isomerase, archaeal
MADKQPGWDWNTPFTRSFSLTDGMSPDRAATKRYLSAMRGMFFDDAAFDAVLDKGNPLVYEFYELGAPADAGDLAFGTSITYPGKVGHEYHMTKGHFHSILETAEVYWCIRGKGMMLMENPEGDWRMEELEPGRVVYVPKRYAHRSINVGTEPFATFFVFRADAGHDYGTIETKGYRKLVVERYGKPVVVDNPKWREDVQ